MHPVASELERRFLPRLEALRAQLQERHPSHAFNVWSSPTGSRTEYQGHDVGVECILSGAASDESDCVALTVGVKHMTTNPVLCEAGVVWGEGSHPDGTFELIDEPLPFSEAALQTVEAHFSELTAALEHAIVKWDSKHAGVSPKKGMNEPTHKGQPVRLDEGARSADPNLPAFIARPPNAPVYHGFPLLRNSEREGFTFGTITEPNGAEPAEWGDAFVVAPNGSRAGIVWQIGKGEPSVVSEPSDGRWGVYGFHFQGPIATEADLVAHLHAILPILKTYYAAAEVSCPESTRAV